MKTTNFSVKNPLENIKIEEVDSLDDNTIYSLRVMQLESEDMTTSDAQAVADYEVERGQIEANVKLHLSGESR